MMVMLSSPIAAGGSLIVASLVRTRISDMGSTTSHAEVSCILEVYYRCSALVASNVVCL